MCIRTWQVRASKMSEKKPGPPANQRLLSGRIELFVSRSTHRRNLRRSCCPKLSKGLDRKTQPQKDKIFYLRSPNRKGYS